MAPRKKAAKTTDQQTRDASATTSAPHMVVSNAPAPTAGMKKRVLHVGCGVQNPEKLHANFRGEDWQEIRMDIDPSVKPDIVSDMSRMHMVKDGEFEAIWSSHNIEHLFFHEVPVALKEFYRVLKLGGFVLITLPDLQTVASYVAQGKLEQKLYDSPAGPITPLDILFGYTKAIAAGNHFMAHKTGFTAETLAYKFHQAGFCNIQVQRRGFDLWAVAYKLPEGHPQRTDKATISVDKKNIPQTPAQPVAMQAGAAPGRTDELDRKPVAWKQLGLNKP